MLKRVALLGAIAALAIGSPSNAVAQGWPGVTITVAGFPAAYPYPRPYYPRPIWCCRRPIIRPCCCCGYRSYYPRPYYRPPYFYGGNFAPYGYHYDAGYTDAGYTEAGYGYGDGP